MPISTCVIVLHVPTHVTVDFACALHAGSTVTCVSRQGQLDTIVQL